jgi:peptide/nickel transport system substrate-binding protein
MQRRHRMGYVRVRASALIAIFLATAGFGFLAFADAPSRRGGTVIFALGGDPSVLNPVLSTAIPDSLLGCILYQGLTRVSTTEGISPMLAKSWTISPDGKTYSFELVKANWQDGTPFTSADVKYSLIEASAKYNPVFAAAGRAIDTIETPAPDRVVIDLKQPFGPLLASLSCSLGGAILPAHVYDGTDVTKNPANNANPVGIGPFKLTEWKRGDYLRLTRNPDYWEPGKPYLDEVIGKIISQPATRAQALMAGDVDYVTDYYLAPNDYAQVKASSNLDLQPANGPPTIDLMFLNLAHKPLDDKRARQALLMGTDREFLAKNAYLGGDVGTMPFTNRLPWAADPSIDYRKMYPFDVARANALLDEIGLKRGPDGMRFKFVLVYAADDVAPPLVAVALKSMWQAIGVDVVNSPTDRTSLNKRTFIDHDFDGMLIGYTSYGDPALGLARIFLTSSIGKLFGNAGGYSNPKVDELFEKGEQATGNEARGVFYRQVQAILADDLPVFTLHEKVVYDGRSKKVKGPRSDNYFYNSWRDNWLEP